MSKRPIEYLAGFFRSGIEKKSVPLSDSSAFQIFGVTPNTIAGPAITASSALRVPAVFSATALISGAVGSLPAKVFSDSPSDGKRTAHDHPSYRLVHREANDWTSAGELRSQLTADALLHDHGYAFANRVNGNVVEFIRLDPRGVSIKADEITGEPTYEVRDGNRVRRYTYGDVLHVSAPLGVSPIKAGREAIGLAKVMEEHAASLFANGARPGGTITSPKVLGDDAKRKIGQGWSLAFGKGGVGGTAVLDEGMAYQAIDTMTSTDAEFTATRAEQVVEIARLFRVPPHLLFELSRATWSNAEEMFQAFLTLTLRPWLDAWEWAYARVLLTPEERNDGYYIEFVVDDLLTANAATRAETYAKYRAMGALTANEVRAGLNRPPIDGGDELGNPNITPGASKPAPDNDNSEADEEAA